MRFPYLLAVFILNTACAQTQNPVEYRLVGSGEGCEAVLEYGERRLQAVDTLPDFREDGPKIRLSGTIYEPDGKTPAEGVILYVYHTNQEGIYPSRASDTGIARRHGYIRGWMKTGSDGRYVFYTLLPGVYPSRTEPAHIHPIILEPNGKYYWLGSYFFEGDSLLNTAERKPKAPRGGSPGVLHLEKDGELLVGERDFILGRNLPGYE